MLCQSVVITGCNRGLGLELVKQLAKCASPPKYIIASCRTPDDAMMLKDIQKNNQQNVIVLKLDMNEESQYENFKMNVEKIVGPDGVNLLINNAGMAPKSTRINMVTRSQMEETFRVNTISPLMLTKTMLPLLKNAAKNFDAEGPLSVRRAAVVNMSSVLGSIQENDTGGLYPYRASKCALNAVTKSLSLDLRRYNILVSSLHPGWVQTDMGGKNAPLTAVQSVSRMIETLGSLSEQSNGAFVQYDGETVPW